MPRLLKIGARGSPLSLAQTNQVAEMLKKNHPGLETQVMIIRTTGDLILDRPLAKVGGKGLFVKEIEEALLAGLIDVAVHSAKDLPSELPAGLGLAAVPPRADHRDVLISRQGGGLEALPPGARVGTSSLRRAAQLLRARPDLEIASVRGNIQTRLGRLGADCHGVVLAAAGLGRLGLVPENASYLEPSAMLPAAGQGSLALEARLDDQAVWALLRAIHHEPSALTLTAERAFLKAAGGSCQAPIAAWACHSGPSEMTLRALIAEPDGSRVFAGNLVFAGARAQEAGRDLARRLLDQGGREIVERLAEAAF